jgi:hypothetical protein
VYILANADSEIPILKTEFTVVETTVEFGLCFSMTEYYDSQNEYETNIL